MTKFKKLKPWQGAIHNRECAACLRPVQRHEFRWRCEQHCRWDLCEGCYERHWAHLIQCALAADDLEERRQLLDTVPLPRRKFLDFVAAENKVGARPSGANWRGPMTDREPPWPLEAALWLLARTAACALLVVVGVELVGKAELAFPGGFLAEGLANLGASVLCWAALLAARSADTGAPGPPGPGPPGLGLSGPPGVPGVPGVSGVPMPAGPGRPCATIDWKSAGVLGLMRGVELGLFAVLFREASVSVRGIALAATPAFFFAAGLLSGRERPRMDLAAAVGCVTLGGLLASLMDADLVGIRMLPLALIAELIAMMRWVFTSNILPAVGEPHRLYLLDLAARMSPPTSLVGFEIAFITDTRCYVEMWFLPKPLYVTLLVTVMAICTAVVTVADLQVVQLTSVTLLGFVTPFARVAGIIFAALVWGTRVSLMNTAGVLLCAVGAVLYAQARSADPGGEPRDSGYVRIQ